MGLRSSVDPVSKLELTEMHTGSLLARLQKLRSLPENFEVSDWSEEKRRSIGGKIAFKNTPTWKDAWCDLKEVLSGREHQPRGSKERRQQAALDKKNR